MLLHLCTVDDWSRARSEGGVDPLPEVGFVHLSTPDQVHLPAQRLFSGRDDVLLLVVDETRLADPVRYEPGVPGDPESMRFPHLYGRLPADAVTAVLLWEPEPPASVPGAGDAPGRRAGLCTSLPVRRALAAGEPVERRTAGWAVGAPGYPASREDNRLVVPAPTTLDQVLADSSPLVRSADTTVTWFWPGAEQDAAHLADELRRNGWRTSQDRVLARWTVTGLPSTGPAEVVDQRHVHGLWADAWQECFPDRPDTVRQLVDREHRNGLAVQVVDVAVQDAGQVVSAGQLQVDGATAVVGAVQTAPAHRGLRHADAVLARLLAEAERARCDLVVLEADEQGWTRDWYARRGFAEIGTHHWASRTGAD